MTLTQEDIERMVQEGEKFKEEDNETKLTIEAKNNPSPPWQQGNKRRRKWNTITNQYELLEKYKED